MKKINKIYVLMLCYVSFCIIFCIIYFSIGFYIIHKKHDNIINKPIIVYDTTYNKVLLDSINYNIKVKDSIIVNLKKKIEYEMEQAINADDSCAIKQFHELAGTN